MNYMLRDVTPIQGHEAVQTRTVLTGQIPPIVTIPKTAAESTLVE